MSAESNSASESPQPPPDHLNAQIGVLTRREVEARILKPIIEALGQEFGEEQVVSIVRRTIIELAETQGAELADLMGGNQSVHFMDSLAYWTQDGALEVDVLAHNDDELSFNVTRCRYAELYRSLGLAELGATLSCNRDFALIDGFNPEATLQRTQTIMQGAAYCDFRYRFQPQDPADKAK